MKALIYGKGKFCLGNFHIYVLCVGVYVCKYTNESSCQNNFYSGSWSKWELKAAVPCNLAKKVCSPLYDRARVGEEIPSCWSKTQEPTHITHIPSSSQCSSLFCKFWGTQNTSCKIKISNQSTKFSLIYSHSIKQPKNCGTIFHQEMQSFSIYEMRHSLTWSRRHPAWLPLTC